MQSVHSIKEDSQEFCGFRTLVNSVCDMLHVQYNKVSFCQLMCLIHSNCLRNGLMLMHQTPLASGCQRLLLRVVSGIRCRSLQGYLCSQLRKFKINSMYNNLILKQGIPNIYKLFCMKLYTVNIAALTCCNSSWCLANPSGSRLHSHETFVKLPCIMTQITADAPQLHASLEQVCD